MLNFNFKRIFNNFFLISFRQFTENIYICALKVHELCSYVNSQYWVFDPSNICKQFKNNLLTL